MDRLFRKDGSHLIAEGDFFKTLQNCQGYYTCPTDAAGKPRGPLVGYTASYDASDGTKKNWVGLTYYNFAKADPWPAVLAYFAEEIAKRLEVDKLLPDIIVGAPWAGVKFSQEVARLVGCRHVFAEKRGDDVILGRYEGEIGERQRVLIGEELANNTSTTGKLVSLIEGVGGRVIGISCAINRSFPFKESFAKDTDSTPLPIVGVIEKETPQYKQDDPLVAEAIKAGNVVWKPKYEWHKMEAAAKAAS